jgi:hypothetical protein
VVRALLLWALLGELIRAGSVEHAKLDSRRGWLSGAGTNQAEPDRGFEIGGEARGLLEAIVSNAPQGCAPS